jgi:pyruvate kinase
MQVMETSSHGARLEVTLPGRIRSRQGINLPGTDLRVDALTPQDYAALDWAAQHEVDFVGLSFVRRAEDVVALRSALEAREIRAHIVAKIEKPQAVLNLKDILAVTDAVMVARGDLGVELGFERLAEVQEEILWLCEAAHVPVIWATQVLESLAKDGTPSRAEVTDAAWSTRAECVMLNKGPHIVRTITFLRDVLARMGAHRDKGTSLMRRLDVAATSAPEPGLVANGSVAEHLSRRER